MVWHYKRGTLYSETLPSIASTNMIAQTFLIVMKKCYVMDHLFNYSKQISTEKLEMGWQLTYSLCDSWVGSTISVLLYVSKYITITHEINVN